MARGPHDRTWVSLVRGAQDTDRSAVVTGDGSWSGRELLRAAAGAVRWLDELGVPAGTPVPALLETDGDALALTLAGAATARPLAPLGTRLTVAELTAVVGGLPGTDLVTQPAFAEIATDVATACGRRARVLPHFPQLPEELPWPAADDPAVVLHTSGTTGVPRAVTYRHDALVARVLVNQELLALGPGSVFATASPFHHIAGIGLLLVALASGATTVAMPRFSVDAWQGLAGYGVTHALAVPTMVEILLRADALALERLEVLQYGAAPMPPETLARAMHALPGVEFVQMYGQTEGSPLTCLTAADHRRAAAGAEHLLQSVGRAAPGVELVLRDTDGHGVGEVTVRAPQVFAPGADGWLRTGDLGRLDEEGYLHLVGRRGDKIIRGGENIYPQEVENVLQEHPAVAEAAVVGVPDELLGEAVKAFVVPADPARPPDLADLARFARAVVAGFKVPEHWELVGELPRNSSGKLLRRLLR